MTNRVSSIPGNIPGCQSGTCSAGQEMIRGGCKQHKWMLLLYIDHNTHEELEDELYHSEYILQQ